MSLIEEALRRMKDPIVPAAPKTAQLPSKAKAEEAAPAHSWPTTTPPSSTTPIPAIQTNALVVVAAAILILTGILVVGGVFWTRQALSQRISRVSPQASTSSTDSPASRSKPNAASDTNPGQGAIAKRNQQDGLTLSGIVEGGGEPYAVINGSIVEVGEQVEDATLLEIANGSVKLRRADGRDVTLSVPR